MNYTDFLDLVFVLCLMIVVNVAYFLLKKFVIWTIEDENKWHKRQGHLGMSQKMLENKKKMALEKLKFGYFLLIGVCVLFVIMIIVRVSQ